MTIPNLPAQGDTSWYDWATGLDTEARKASVQSGATASRPGSAVVGQSYFDTTLGRPVWWGGAGWVDAGGIAV